MYPNQQPQGFQQPGTEVWALAEEIKRWLFDKLGTVTEKYVLCLEGSMTSTEVRNFGAAALTLYLHLSDKIRRNRDDAIAELGQETYEMIEEYRMRPSKFAREKLSSDNFEFWAKIFNYEVHFLDRIGITKVDKEKVSGVMEMLEGMDDRPRV